MQEPPEAARERVRATVAMPHDVRAQTDAPPAAEFTAAEPAVPDSKPGETPGRTSDKERAKGRWELSIAIVMAVITLTSAAVTYLAVRAESTASAYDQQAVVETVLVSTHQNGAQSRVVGQEGIAGQYRALLARADALAASDPAEAQALRSAAAGIYARAVLGDGLSGTGAGATFDSQAQLLVDLHRTDYASTPDDQPARTTRLADAYHRRTEILSGAVVLLLTMLVAATWARVTQRPVLRVPLLVVAFVGYAAAAATAVLTTV